MFTQRRNESEFLKKNRYYRQHFTTVIGPVFQGQIIQQTAKAYEIEVHLSPSQRHIIWVPKSVTCIRRSALVEPVQLFELEEWFYERERDKLNKGL